MIGNKSRIDHPGNLSDARFPRANSVNEMREMRDVQDFADEVPLLG
jgi:hypothetical protein